MCTIVSIRAVPITIHVYDFPSTTEQVSVRRLTRWVIQCRTRAAQNVEEHHRPAIDFFDSACIAHSLGKQLNGPSGISTDEETPYSNVNGLSYALTSQIRDHKLLNHKDLVRYRNQADKSTHQLGTAMHHHSPDHESASGLSIHWVSGPDKLSRVGSN